MSSIGAIGDALSAAPIIKFPIIDTHIHLFDPTRTGGVPWPPKDDAAVYKPALPIRYEEMTRTLGVVGAIVVEASPLESDNDWVLQQAADHPMIVGLVGIQFPERRRMERHSIGYTPILCSSESVTATCGTAIWAPTARSPVLFLIFVNWLQPGWDWIVRIRTQNSFGRCWKFRSRFRNSRL